MIFPMPLNKIVLTNVMLTDVMSCASMSLKMCVAIEDMRTYWASPDFDLSLAIQINFLIFFFKIHD